MEALRVGLAVGPLWRSCRLHDDRRHLDQLERRLAFPQRLAQIQDLEEQDMRGNVSDREVH